MLDGLDESPRDDHTGKSPAAALGSPSDRIFVLLDVKDVDVAVDPASTSGTAHFRLMDLQDQLMQNSRCVRPFQKLDVVR